MSDFWPQGEVATTYGVFNDVAGVARRGTFLIDTEGIIRFAEVQQTDTARDQRAWHEAITTVLEPAKRQNSGVVVLMATGTWIDLPSGSPA